MDIMKSISKCNTLALPVHCLVTWSYDTVAVMNYIPALTLYEKKIINKLICLLLNIQFHKFLGGGRHKELLPYSQPLLYYYWSTQLNMLCHCQDFFNLQANAMFSIIDTMVSLHWYNLHMINALLLDDWFMKLILHNN